jgi:hypothetical protein
MSTAKKLFKRAAVFLDLIDKIVPVASTHGYTFVSDEWFEQWRQSDDFTIERMNFIVALELIEKAHLASMSALLRARRYGRANRDRGGIQVRQRATVRGRTSNQNCYVRFGSLADKLSPAKLRLCPLLSKSGHRKARHLAQEQSPR